MVLTSQRSKRQSTGARYKAYRGKRVFEIRNRPMLTKIGERKVKVTRIAGGSVKKALMSDKLVNVFDPKKKKYSKVEVKTILENAANRHFVRRNIVTKGAVVETPLGKVRITSRPGQEAVLNGILV
ncbi:30S ribosomal protein S8e [archaeon]|jgi:small subunit ribosomal protein S8e|nr:30S ribosomal protein S8e [archaeon]MBT4417209.1 30S ribosomal protein S8e [archaeon]